MIPFTIETDQGYRKLLNGGRERSLEALERGGSAGPVHVGHFDEGVGVYDCIL